MTPSGRATPREDISAMEGYHSPQLDVEVRLNTNEAPVPPPDEFSRRLADRVRSIDWNRYPSRDARALRSRLAAQYGVETENVFVANGSNEVLQSVLLAYGGFGRSAATFEPTYALHSHIASVTGTEVRSLDRDQNFEIDPDLAADFVSTNRPQIVFLCSPNNPTGVVDPPGLGEQLADLTAGYGGLVVVDEAYGQFAETSAVSLVSEDRPLAVSRTFSKTWSMAAARLGYLIAPTWLVSDLEKVVLPYHLDAMKQEAGLLTLEFDDLMRARVADLVAERQRLERLLSSLPVRFWSSGANFVLFRPEVMPGRQVWDGLVERGVLVRDCSSWDRLDDCLRVTVGTPDEDDRFIAALAEVLQS